MINIILFGSFFVMLFLNVPICVSLGMSSILAMIYSGDKLSIVPTNVYNGMAKFLLLAIPFFVLSGNIMAKAGISTRLVQFIDDCVGHRRGGIAIVCVVVACFFDENIEVRPDARSDPVLPDPSTLPSMLPRSVCAVAP